MSEALDRSLRPRRGAEPVPASSATQRREAEASLDPSGPPTAVGGLGALVGTYAQGSDVLREGPIAIAAALGLTIVATFAWYGAQETPPRQPWRNGLATILGVAWIPALLALVFPMAELPRSDRFPIIIVLLLAVAAFDVGSYFVGKHSPQAQAMVELSTRQESHRSARRQRTSHRPFRASEIAGPWSATCRPSRSKSADSSPVIRTDRIATRV